MKNVYFIISLILILGIVYLIMVNLTNVEPVHYATTMLKQTLLPEVADGNSVLTRVVGSKAYLYSNINIAVLIAGVLISGIISGAGIVYMFLSAANAKIKAYERELEKTSVTGQNNASKVDVLEAKIKTLEKAFNTVIDERTKLELQIKNLHSELDSLNKKQD